MKNFNVVAVGTSVDVTPRLSDARGSCSRSRDKDKLFAGQMKKEPLAIRINVGDCGAVAPTSEERDADVFGGYAKVEMHIHHVQFDPQGLTEPRWASASSTASARTRSKTPSLPSLQQRADTVKVNRIDAKYRPGVAFGIGLGKDSIEEATIVSMNAATRTIVVDRPLTTNHAAGEGAGVEFIRYRWYTDAFFDNIFWHDHVDGIHGWGPVASAC